MIDSVFLHKKYEYSRLNTSCHSTRTHTKPVKAFYRRQRSCRR